MDGRAVSFLGCSRNVWRSNAIWSALLLVVSLLRWWPLYPYALEPGLALQQYAMHLLRWMFFFPGFLMCGIMAHIAGRQSDNQNPTIICTAIAILVFGAALVVGVLALSIVKQDAAPLIQLSRNWSTVVEQALLAGLFLGLPNARRLSRTTEPTTQRPTGSTSQQSTND